MNLAVLWHLPILYVCDNNSIAHEKRKPGQYPSSRLSNDDLTAAPASFGIPSVSVSGSDVAQLTDLFDPLTSDVRDGAGPQFVEVRFERWPGNYDLWPAMVGQETELTWAWAQVAPPELAAWCAHADPILGEVADLLHNQLATRSELLALDAGVRSRIDREAPARAGEPPSRACARVPPRADIPGERPVRLSYAQAMADAIYRAAPEDPDVVFLGNGWVGLNVAAREAFTAFDTDFSDRVLSKPVSELGLAGAGIGALGGCRPMVDLATADFLYQAFPQIVDEAATVRYVTAGRQSVPVTFYAMAGVRGAGAPQHSARPQAMLAGVPGLQVVLPSSPSDVHGLLRWALLRSSDPTVFLTHPKLFAEEEEGRRRRPADPFGQARIRRAGDDITIVATTIMVPRSLEAAEELAAEGVSVEVVDPRSLNPLDTEVVLASVCKTRRALVADESSRSFGAGAELAATIAEHAFESLRAPVCRVATPDVPIPYSEPLERELVVSAEKIAAATRGLLDRSR